MKKKLWPGWVDPLDQGDFYILSIHTTQVSNIEKAIRLLVIDYMVPFKLIDG